MDNLEYTMHTPYKKVQFICDKKTGEIVACYYERMHLSLNQIFQIPKVHAVYHEYLRRKK